MSLGSTKWARPPATWQTKVQISVERGIHI